LWTRPRQGVFIGYEVLFYNQACFLLIRNEADPEVLAPCDETEADSLEKKEELGVPKFLYRLENVAKRYSSR